MDEYIGTNTKSLYSKIRINKSIFNIVYLFIFLSLLILGLVFDIIGLINYYINNNAFVFLLAIYYILAIVILFFIGMNIITIIGNIHIIINNYKTIKYYNNNKLINVKKMMIPYDYKLWLVAPKDTFHAMSIDFIVDGEMKSNKTSIIFTNSNTYYKFPKFKMPEELISKNYVNNWALVGYDELNKEVVVIGYVKENKNE